MNECRNCTKCSRPVPENERVVYGLCEDCFCGQRTHPKHCKVGGEKTHIATRQRGHGLRVRRIF